MWNQCGFCIFFIIVHIKLYTDQCFDIKLISQAFQYFKITDMLEILQLFVHSFFSYFLVVVISVVSPSSFAL